MIKKLMVAAAATALTAAMAVPALALENEFHGAFAVRGNHSNYNQGGKAGYLLAGANNDTESRTNWVEQRLRLFYSAKANDNLKLVTGFEIDSVWGKSSYVVGSGGNGGALGADSVNLETKWLYLDFTEPASQVNVKAGIQGLTDAYKGIIVGGGADAAGLLVGKAFGPVTTSLGWFRLDDRSNAVDSTNVNGGSIAANTTTGAITNTALNFTDGKKIRDLLIADAKFALNKSVKLGASYYFLNGDNAAVSNGRVPVDYNVHIVGVNAAGAVGPVALDGFLVYEFGADQSQAPTARHISAYAANAAAKVKAGPGTVKVAALYVSGGSNAFYNVNNENSANFSENSVNAIGNMLLLARNSQYTTHDQFIVYDSSNLRQGIIGGSVAYDMNITDKLYTNVAAGFLAVAKDVAGARPGRDESNYQGTEINAEVGYKVFDSLTASVQGAYVKLGDYYKGTGNGGTDPSDPYLARIILSYVF